MVPHYWHWNAILLLACTAFHSARAADPQAVWEQAIQAKGGHQRLQKVQTLAIYMKSAEVTLTGPPATWLCVFPNRYFEWDARNSGSYPFLNANGVWAMAGSPRSIIVDGAAGRVAMDANGMPHAAWKLTPIERDRLILNQLLYLLETAWLRPEPVAVKQALRLHKSNVLTVRAGGRTFDLFLNSANLPERIFSRRGEDTKTKYDYQMERYREFQGIMLPTRVSSSMGNRQWNWDVDYEIDAKYNPKMFERPPDLADGPEPWRRR